jgi:uncharacterized protein YkwD
MKKQNLLNLFWISFVITAPYLSYAQGNLESMRQMIFEKTNELRVLAGYPVLIPLDSLMELAQYHSVNMVEHRFYSHTDHEGLNPLGRAEKKGINPWVKKGSRFSGIAENIAKTPWFKNVQGCGDTRSESTLTDCMVLGWRNSEPHYKNILGDYTYLGVGLFFDDGGIGYGTQNFR